MARFAALLCVLAVLAPAAALAQNGGGGAFQPLPPAPPEQPEPAAPQSSSNDDDEGLNDTQQLLIAIAGFVLLFGIGWAILRDARASAPVAARAASGDPDAQRPKGSQRPARVRHQQSRSKSKAARQARKKARKR